MRSSTGIVHRGTFGPAGRTVAALLGAVFAVMMSGPVAAAAAGPLVAATPSSPTDESKVPHYFGPYPNWANSPQVLADAIVTLSNGGGTGAEATATVDPKTGGIAAITVTNPGSGYLTPPDVADHGRGRDPDPRRAATAQISHAA